MNFYIMKYPVGLIILLLMILPFSCCISDNEKNETEFFLTHLYVSNQSFSDSLINISISIDEVEYFNKSCFVGDQHIWEYIEFNLSKGKHDFVAIELNSNTIGFTTFDIQNENWIVIDFWYYTESDFPHASPEPRHFTFDISSTEVGFV